MANPSLIQTIKSVLSAFIGVQSEKNRQHDFQEGSLKTFIIAGVIFTVCFVGAVVFVVSMVLK